MSDNSQALPPREQINQLVGLMNAGRLRDALVLGSNMVAQYPGVPFLHNILGIVLLHTGHAEQAVASLQRSIALKPDYEEAHNNLGNVLKELGRIDEAVRCYQQALSVKPHYAEAHNNLGAALHLQGKMDEAVSAFEQAIKINPNYAKAYHNLGDVCFDQRKYTDAVSLYAKSVELDPGAYESHINISLAYRMVDQLDKALEHASVATKIVPQYPNAQNNLGTVLATMERFEEAARCFEEALNARPDYADAHSNYGNALKKLGKPDEAIAHYVKAIDLSPDMKATWKQLANSLLNLTFSEYSDYWAEVILKVLAKNDLVRPREIVSTVLNLLNQHPDIVDAKAKLSEGNSGTEVEGVCLKLAKIPLLLRIAELCPISDLDFEALLVQLRKLALLNAGLIQDKEGVTPVLAAIALNCFTNEYIFDESEEETKAIAEIERSLMSLIETDGQIDPYQLVCFASYRSLSDYAGLHDIAVPEALKSVFERQVIEVLKEKEIGSDIRLLKEIENEVSSEVQSQYEENPYPRWVSVGLPAQPLTIDGVVSDLGLKLSEGIEGLSDAPSVLMGGCGTGQNSIGTASLFANCQMTAVDLSVSSLSYAIRKTKELGISNIEYLQGDILDLAELGQQFDVVESSGVLHHMQDPMAGWQVLVDCLKAGGLMKIALYSELARQNIVKARAEIANRDLSPVANDIKSFRRELIASDNESLSGLKVFRDFFSMSELRDLLFHVQEHRFTIPQLKACLDKLGLAFIGFDSVREHSLTLFAEEHPQPDAIYDLDCWHEFEQNHPDTFIAMYQFWVQKKTA